MSIYFAVVLNMIIDIYYDKLDQLQQQMKTLVSNKPAEIDTPVNISEKPKLMWQYRTEGNVYGPFPGEQMQEWFKSVF